MRAVRREPPLQIFGEHTGNGEALANFILDHYGAWYAGRSTKPPLLFLVGEQRRDIIPKTLADPRLDAGRRIGVDEVVVYGTGEMESFPGDFESVLSATASSGARWVVVFSPTGCDSMLRGLGLLDEETGRARPPSTSARATRTTWVATIGPTTRDYLRSRFEFEPDACSLRPTPEGVWDGIADFMRNRS